MLSLTILILHKKQKYVTILYHKGGSSKVDALGEICQQLVIERLNPIYIATLGLSREL